MFLNYIATVYIKSKLTATRHMNHAVVSPQKTSKSSTLKTSMLHLRNERTPSQQLLVFVFDVTMVAAATVNSCDIYTADG